MIIYVVCLIDINHNRMKLPKYVSRKITVSMLGRQPAVYTIMINILAYIFVCLQKKSTHQSIQLPCHQSWWNWLDSYSNNPTTSVSVMVYIAPDFPGRYGFPQLKSKPIQITFWVYPNRDIFLVIIKISVQHFVMTFLQCQLKWKTRPTLVRR